MPPSTMELETGIALVPKRLGGVPPSISKPWHREWWVGLALLLGSFAYLCVFCRYTTIEPDEGIVLEGAQRILRGELPYRDFFSFYTPGSYYLQALFFKILGDSLPASRLALAACGAVVSLLTYLIALRFAKRRIALSVALLVTLTTLPFRFLVLHNWYSTLWACLALYCAIRLLESAGLGWSLGVGTFAACTVLFEQSKGAGLCLGLGLGLGAIFVIQLPRARFSRDHWDALLLGFAWPIAVTLAYFASQHALGIAISDWLWPLRHYSQANRVAYGYQNWSDAARQQLLFSGSILERAVKILAVSPCLWIPVLPLIALSVFVYCNRDSVRDRMPEIKVSQYLLVGGASAGLLFSVIVVRADIIHFMYLQPVFAVVLAWMVDGDAIPGKFLMKTRSLLSAYLVIALVALAIPPLLATLGANHTVTSRRGRITTRGQDTVIDYVQAHVLPGEKLLVYPYLPLYSYLTETSNPSRYDYFQSGMNTDVQEAEILATLRASRTPSVLFEMSFKEKIPRSWPGTSLHAIASDPVADYIVVNYRSCRVLRSPAPWTLLFMVRNDLACPLGEE